MRDTCSPSNNLPTPFPGVAASLLIRVRPDFFCRTSSSSRRSGVPTPMKPPTMMLAPFGIMATASSTETDFMIGLRLLIGGQGVRKTVASGPARDVDLGQGDDHSLS